MIVVNGDSLKWFENITVADVLKIKKYVFPMIVVTVNNVYVSPEDYKTVTIPDNASVQVTHLISGG